MKRAGDIGSTLQQEVIPVAPNRSQLISSEKCFTNMPNDLTLVTVRSLPPGMGSGVWMVERSDSAMDKRHFM
jgi:hypothetical protein